MAFVTSRLVSPLLRTAAYDSGVRLLVLEFTDGSRREYRAVAYSTYLALVRSRFPEKTWRQLLRARILS